MKLFFLPLVFFICVDSYSQENAIVAASTIENVTVFQRKAQVHREASVMLLPGDNLLKFEGLAANLDGSSIQVGGDTEFTIVSVKHNRNYMKDPVVSPQLKILKESLNDVEFKLEMRNRYLSVFEAEKSLLLANKNVGGSQTGLDVEDLIEVADLYRSRLVELEIKILDISEERKEFQKEVKKLKKQVNELNGKATKNTNEITIRISAESKAKTKIFLSYVVSEAGWKPLYDIRSKGAPNPVNLSYKGNVWQHTGSDWNNVTLTLSTGNPTLSNTAPTVKPWALQFQPIISNQNFKGNYGNSRRQYASPEINDADDYEEEDAAETADSFEPTSLRPDVVVSQGNVNTEFEIKIPYTIPSNGQYNAVEIQSHALTANYQFYAAPKFDKDAFLMAKIANWSNLNLLSGKANIYYDGTFIGSSFIDAAITKDTMELSLGRDFAVVVDRKKIKDYCKESTIGSSIKKTLGLQVNIRNTKNIPITILLQDQIPISKTKEIEITTVETSNAKYQESTGKLEWKITLLPGETKTVEFKYQVKYPKSKTIRNL